MWGIIFSVVAGVLISFQSIFNTRASEKIGLWETNIVVHGLGLLLAVMVFLFIGEGNFSKIQEVRKLYLIGGACGVMIVFSAMKGVSLLGPTISIAVMLVAQLLMALSIELLGLFGTDKVSFHITQPLGLVLMVAGIFLFKWKG